MKVVFRQDASPPLAAVDHNGLAALVHGEPFQDPDEEAPMLQAVAATGDDGAELLAVGAVQCGHGSRVDFRSVPGEPEQRLGVMDITFHYLEVRQAASHRRLDE